MKYSNVVYAIIDISIGIIVIVASFIIKLGADNVIISILEYVKYSIHMFAHELCSTCYYQTV